MLTVMSQISQKGPKALASLPSLIMVKNIRLRRQYWKRPGRTKLWKANFVHNIAFPGEWRDNLVIFSPL